MKFISILCVLFLTIPSYANNSSNKCNQLANKLANNLVKCKVRVTLCGAIPILPFKAACIQTEVRKCIGRKKISKKNVLKCKKQLNKKIQSFNKKHKAILPKIL